MRRLAVVLLLDAASPAWAGDKPVYAAAPDWVKPAPPVDATKLGDAAPVLLLLDNQQRLADGQVWSYTDTATRAASAQALSAIGTISIPWQPAHGDLVVHRAEIIRGGERIDLLAGGKGFTVIRREQQLDQRALDGVLTATLPVEGLRVGDVVHATFSITSKDPTLKGQVQTVAPLMFDPFRVQFARVRLLWPEAQPIRWKAYADGVAARPMAIGGGYNELTVALPLAKQPDMPKDAPLRFQKLPMMDATSFADWGQVAAVMAPLYATDGLIPAGSPLATEVARIAAATRDPATRAAMALRLVQEKVRYQLMGMETGNYVPQAPALTWSMRYGDCKAKTLLLLAMLHGLGVEAEPVLASANLAGLVADRLPSPAAFDHVLVRADVAGETLWLDGTRNGARLADLRDTPVIGHVLPVRATGAALLAVTPRADARADVAATLDIDQSAGVDLPAPFRATLTLRGQAAEMMRLGAAQGSKEDLDQAAESMVRNLANGATVAEHRLGFDEAAGTATLEASGLSYPAWTRQGERWTEQLDQTVSELSFAPDRARAAWREIPVAIGTPEGVDMRKTIKLPDGGEGFTIEGDAPLSTSFAGTAVTRKVTRSGATVTVETRVRSSGGEIAASAIAEGLRNLAAAKARQPRLLSPAGYPERWRIAAGDDAARRFAPLLAVFDKRVADKPDMADRYTDRAWFHERVFDYKAAAADYDRAIAIAPDAESYLERAAVRHALGDEKGAIADATEADQLDPASTQVARTLALWRADAGEGAEALAMLQERIDAGGDGRSALLAVKAEVEARGGDHAAAFATLDAGLARNPGDADLLNMRCWVKGTMSVALDTALKDCTRAIELSDNPAAALDSRALVYYRLNRTEDALADLDAALTHDATQAGSMYLRAVMRKRAGDANAAASDVSGARMIDPTVDRTYKRYGIAY